MVYPIYLNFIMEQMEDENCTMEFEEVFTQNKHPDDLRFDSIINELQEIVIDPHFEKTLDAFMKSNWASFGDNSNKQKEREVFLGYKQEIEHYLQNCIRNKIPDFTWEQFRGLLSTRRNLIDEQILDTLLSLEEIQSFQSFIKDFRSSFEEVEMFKVLTIKSNKISENKKVKGKDNIFSGGDAGLFEKGLKMPVQKKKVVEKTEEELMVPDLILTIRSMRKG